MRASRLQREQAREERSRRRPTKCHEHNASTSPSRFPTILHSVVPKALARARGLELTPNHQTMASEMRDNSAGSSTDQAVPLPWQRTLLFLSAVATVVFLVWLLSYARYGLDFTDEGFYLNWISNPFPYSWSLTQFGFVYHPLYVLLGGDIASVRQANILIVFCLAWILFALVLRGNSTEPIAGNFSRPVLSAGFAVAALVVFSSWLVTPNYNTLNFQALLLTSIGVLLAGQATSRHSIAGGILIGVGGWLSFMAKPSTALLLAPCVLVYLMLSRKWSLRLLGIAFVTVLALFYLSSRLIDGSVAGFLTRLQTALSLSAHLDAGYTLEKILRLDSYLLRTNEKLAIAALSFLTFLAAWGVIAERPGLKRLTLLISTAFLASALAIVGGFVQGPTGFGTFQGIVMWSLVLASIALALAGYGMRAFENLPPPHWPLALYFLVLPYVYAFGTNGNYWWAAGFVSVFWLTAGIVLLIPLSRRKSGWTFALPMAIATQALSATLLLTGINQPYRQTQALWLNGSQTPIRDDRSMLVLSSGYARYIEDAQRAARNGGLTPATPVIDLTGQSPGLLYALQALSLGQPWMIGGYAGSQKLADAIIGRVPCAPLSEAWLLVEPSGPRSLSAELVGSYGAQLGTDFRLVAEWDTAPGAGGYAEPRKQQLFKPVHPPSVSARCSAMDRRTQLH